MHYIKLFRPKKRMLVCDTCRSLLKRRGFKYIIERQKVKNQQCELCGDTNGTVSEQPNL